VTAPRRVFNGAVTSLWSVLSPAYDLPFLQQWVYRPPHNEVIAQLRAHESRRIADIACGTGILSDRIERELHPEAIYEPLGVCTRYEVRVSARRLRDDDAHRLVRIRAGVCGGRCTASEHQSCRANERA